MDDRPADEKPMKFLLEEWLKNHKSRRPGAKPESGYNLDNLAAGRVGYSVRPKDKPRKPRGRKPGCKKQ